MREDCTDVKTELETGEYALSGSGSHGNLSEGRRKAKYYYHCMGRNDLLRSGYGIHFHTKKRYSYALIRDTREFVLNLTTKKLAAATDYCGVCSGRDTDKFAQTGLTPCDSMAVNCPGIAESPVNIECKVTEIKPLGSHDLFLAEVVNVAVDDALLDETGRLHLDRSGLIAYSHGGYYELGRQLGTFGYSVRKKKTHAQKRTKNLTKKKQAHRK